MSILRKMMRYPGNDPENGPAYLQVFDGAEWHCAEHKFVTGIDHDPETGEEFEVTHCVHCGDWPSDHSAHVLAWYEFTSAMSDGEFDDWKASNASRR